MGVVYVGQGERITAASLARESSLESEAVSDSRESLMLSLIVATCKLD
jgi:hypothetical protein